MHQTTKRLSKILAVGAAAALTLTACGGGSNSDSSGSGAEGGKGGVIKAAVMYETQTYTPVAASSALALSANWHVMEGLYELDMATGVPYKALAKQDEPTKVSDTEYEVALRDDAKYSDGSEVKAEDIVNSWKKNTSDDSLYAPMLSFIKEVKAKDDHTVSIELNYPFSLLKDRLPLIKAFPASASDDDLAKQPIGSGPYKYESIEENQKIVFVPNEHYNGDKPAGADKMEWSILKDNTARATALQSGEVQVMESVPPALRDLVEGAGAKIENVQGFGLPFLMFNTKKAPFDNAKVRQAIFYAIDIDKLIDNAMAGEAAAAKSFLPENHKNFHQAKNVYTYDADKAKALLDEAGVKDLSITLMTTDHDWIKALSPQIKNNLEAIGIKTEIHEEASSSLYSNNLDIENPTFDIVLAPGDPAVFGSDPDLLMSWWYGDGPWTEKRSQWKGSEGYEKLHKLMEEAVQATGEEQQAKWNECFDVLSEEVPLYPLFHRQIPTAVYTDKIKDYKPIGTTGLNFVGASAVEKQ